MTGASPRFVAAHAGAVPSEPDGRLHSPSFERNYAPIRDALGAAFAGRSGTVLEIGSGPGQHVTHLARDIPGLDWQPSDPDPAHLESIAAWRAHLEPRTLRAPIRLDATDDWTAIPAVAACIPLTAVYAQNVIHIAPWSVAEGLVAGAAQCLGPGGLLVFYGPFAEGGRHVAESNARFDAALRARDPSWGVRDLDAVAALAAAAGFMAPRRMEMPSNNRIAIFARP